MKEYNRDVDLKLLSNTINKINKSTNFQTTAEIIFGFIKRFIDFNMAVIKKIYWKLSPVLARMRKSSREECPLK